MNYKKEQEIPFGAFDSELMHQEINIPEGFEATIDGNKIILKKIEPEDERIRKAIIELVRQSSEILGMQNQSNMIAWLEKQDNSAVKDYNNIDPHFGKPIDKVEPKFKVKYAGGEYNVFETKEIAGVTFYRIEDEQNHIDYVKAENCKIISGYAIKENGSPCPTKPAVFSEQKPAWSQEDREYMESLLDIINGTPSLTPSEVECHKDWLKNLKQRIGE